MHRALLDGGETWEKVFVFDFAASSKRQSLNVIGFLDIALQQLTGFDLLDRNIGTRTISLQDVSGATMPLREHDSHLKQLIVHMGPVYSGFVDIAKGASLEGTADTLKGKYSALLK